MERRQVRKREVAAWAQRRPAGASAVRQRVRSLPRPGRIRLAAVRQPRHHQFAHRHRGSIIARRKQRRSSASRPFVPPGRNRPPRMCQTRPSRWGTNRRRGLLGGLDIGPRGCNTWNRRTGPGGCSSAVERHVANVNVEGSNPFTRFSRRFSRDSATYPGRRGRASRVPIHRLRRALPDRIRKRETSPMNTV